MNSKKKGDTREKQVKKLLELKGYLVMAAQRTMKPIYTKNGVRYFSQANDFYGLFDGLYRYKNRKLVWYQVKSDMSDVYKAKKAISEWVYDHANYICEEFEVWMYVKREGFKIYSYLPVNEDWKESFINFKGLIIDNR